MTWSWADALNHLHMAAAGERPRAVDVRDGDIDADLASLITASARDAGLAVDTETTGLDPLHDSLQVVSIATPEIAVVVTVETGVTPRRLVSLLEEESIQKIFHNAFFDLSFLAVAWNCRPSSIYCTKVGARVAGIELNPTLQSLARDLLQVDLDKTQRQSNWSARPLSSQQIDYAVGDVVHLHALRSAIDKRLSMEHQESLFQMCMNFLAARVELQLRGLGDVFSYQLS